MTPQRNAGPPIAVLVVDDNEAERMLIRHRLQQAGMRVSTAGSGEDALAVLDGVDLVLLDHRLPGGLSGLETMHRIRARSGPSVVLVTGMGDEELAVQAMRGGAIDYLIKETGYLDRLPEAIERAWRQHDLSRRAGELQRLALLVTSASDRKTVCHEIVVGARRLLRADGCAIYVRGPARVRLEAVDGDVLRDRRALQREAKAALDSAPLALGASTTTDLLLVPVPAPDREALGVLAVVTATPRSYEHEELDLVRVFASFAGIALGHLRRLELERAAVAELQQTLDLRRELVASVSHELRTPLTCVMGFANTLVSHWDELEDTDRLDWLKKIDMHAGELATLVDQLLGYAAAEAGRLGAELRVIDVSEVVESTVTALTPLLADRPLDIDVEPANVMADPTLLQRTITNLVSNAVKYSDPESPIAVRAHKDGTSVRVDVVDRGVGLSPEEAGRVFDPFWRSRDARASAVRGTGIGLALVAEYTRLMGGTVGVDSELGQGSTFWFTLPSESARPDDA